MSDRDEGKASDKGSGAGSSRDVLGSLPRTRPQRPSARREAARGARATSQRASSGSERASSGSGSANGKAGRAAGAARAKGTGATKGAAKATGAPRAGASGAGKAKSPAPGAAASSRGKRRSSGQGARSRDAAAPTVAPPQGFEPDTSHSVDPPSGAEVLGAAVGAAGELAQASLGLSRRVLRGAFSWVPRR
jgi:hypothetical protein